MSGSSSTMRILCRRSSASLPPVVIAFPATSFSPACVSIPTPASGGGVARLRAHDPRAFLDRQHQREGAAPAGRALPLDGTAVRLHDVLDQRKSEAAALGLVHQAVLGDI